MISKPYVEQAARDKTRAEEEKASYVPEPAPATKSRASKKAAKPASEDDEEDDDDE